MGEEISSSMGDLELHDQGPACEVNGSQLEMSSLPVSSAVSLKSNRSMNQPISYSGIPLPQEERSSSPLPSYVSMKSDRCIKMPISNTGKPQADNSFQLIRQSAASGVSLKSDISMKIPINYRDEPLQPDESLQLKRSGCVSMKSERPMEMLIDYRGERMTPEEIFDADTLKAQMENLKLTLRERYQYLFEGTVQQGNPLPLNKICTELHITESVNEAHSTHHELSHIQSLTGDTPINCNEIFNSLPGQDKPIKTVLMKGVAGIGKTVSVQKFILDWAEGKANQNIHFIFPLPFREINLMRDQKYSLNDLLQHFFMKGINASSPQITSNSLVLIFDGLDECRLPLDFQSNKTLWDASKETSVDVLLTNLIKGNLLPSANIWITSRPAASSRIPTECIDRVTEVRGFSDPQKVEYFMKKISDQSLATRIITHLKSLRSFYIMCHIPVFCWIAATVLERMVVDCGWDKIPKSLTQMYTHFLITQINTKKAKYSESKANDKEMILKLGKLAFEQLEKGNLIFYEEDLRDCGIDIREASVYSGVFTQIFREEFRLFQRKVFSFMHLSIQEHLAALYVFLSFYNYNQNVLNPQQAGESKQPGTMFSLLQIAVDKAFESDSGHLDLFLRFLMGFSLESNQVLLQDLLVQRSSHPDETKETITYLKEQISRTSCPYMFLKCFHCLNELNDCSLVDEIQTFLRNQNQNKDQMSPSLWSALVFTIVTSDEKLDVFDLSKYGTSDDTLLRLIAVFKLSRTARFRFRKRYCSWRKLLVITAQTDRKDKALRDKKFNNCNITVRGCAALTAALHIMLATRELDLSHNTVQDAGVKILCTGIQGDTAEKKLLYCSDMTEKSLSALDKSFNPLCKKEQTLVWDNTTTLLHCFIDTLQKKHDIKEFLGLQGTPCNIEVLRLKSCGVTSVGCGFLALVLSSHSSNLRELDLSQNNIGDSGVKVLSDALKRPLSKLDTLKLNECGITENSCAALASVFSSESSCLRELDLSINDLKNSGVKLLSVGLGSPHCRLHRLMLYKCNVTEEGYVALAEALQSNPSLLIECLMMMSPDTTEHSCCLIQERL